MCPQPTSNSANRFTKRILTSSKLENVGSTDPSSQTNTNIREVTPGITALEYHHRRAALAEKLPRHSVAVLAANDLKYRSGPVFYEYHQEPNFFYLTGFNEPEAVAVIGGLVSCIQSHEQ